MPLLAEFDGAAAFAVPSRRRPLVAGLVLNAGFAAAFLCPAVLVDGAQRLLAVLCLAFFLYVGMATWRSLKAGATYYLTPWGLSLRDGAGTLGVPWEDVQGFMPIHYRQKLVGCKVRFVEGSLSAQGSARLWQGVNRQLGAEFLLRTNAHVGGSDRMAALLAWCLIPAHRATIGTEQARQAFREMVRNANPSGSTKLSG